jgi:Bacterial toxin 24
MIIIPGAAKITISDGGYFPLKGRQANEAIVRLNSDGTVSNYATYNEEGMIIKRVDLEGIAHGGVETPHVVEYDYNTNPKTGEVFPRQQPWVRPATPDELIGSNPAAVFAENEDAVEGDDGE